MVTIVDLVNVKYSRATSDMVKVWIEARIVLISTNYSTPVLLR